MKCFSVAVSVLVKYLQCYCEFTCDVCVLVCMYIARRVCMQKLRVKLDFLRNIQYFYVKTGENTCVVTREC